MESLLQAKYKFYAHESGQSHVACDEYSLPKALRQHVDIVMPTVHFDTKILTDPSRGSKKRSIPPSVNPGDPNNNGFLPKQGKIISTPGASPDAVPQVAACNAQITPDCLRSLYNLPNGTLAKSSYAVVEYTPQAYLQSDLNKFYSSEAREIPSGTAPIFDSIDGGVDQVSCYLKLERE